MHRIIYPEHVEKVPLFKEPEVERLSEPSYVLLPTTQEIMTELEQGLEFDLALRRLILS